MLIQKKIFFKFCLIVLITSAVVSSYEVKANEVASTRHIEIEEEDILPMFKYSKTAWREYIFDLRAKGETADGWGSYQLGNKDGEYEMISYNNWYNHFPNIGYSMYSVLPTFYNEGEPEMIELKWDFFLTISEWTKIDAPEFCKKFMSQTKQKVRSSFRTHSTCYTKMTKSLEDVWFEMRIIFYKN